jgi:hypothetical protein
MNIGNGSNVLLSINGVYLAAQVHFGWWLSFIFNLISGMPFNPKISIFPIISNLAMLSGINFHSFSHRLISQIIRALILNGNFWTF